MTLPTATLHCPIAPSSRRANRKSARPAVAGTSPPKIIRWGAAFTPLHRSHTENVRNHFPRHSHSHVEAV